MFKSTRHGTIEMPSIWWSESGVNTAHSFCIEKTNGTAFASGVMSENNVQRPCGAHKLSRKSSGGATISNIPVPRFTSPVCLKLFLLSWRLVWSSDNAILHLRWSGGPFRQKR